MSLGRSQHYILDIHKRADFSDLLLAVNAPATPAPRGVRAVMHDGEAVITVGEWAARRL